MPNTPTKAEEVSKVIRNYAGTLFDSERRAAMVVRIMDIRDVTNDQIAKIIDDSSFAPQDKIDCATAISALLNDQPYDKRERAPKPLAVPALRRV